MDNDNDSRQWSELVPDALGIIFDHLSSEEKLTVIPSVCKSWRIVLMGPYCWRDLDIEEWSRKQLPYRADRMIQMLIKWRRPVSKLCVSGLHSSASFFLIAKNAGSLQILRLQRSSLTDSITENLAPNLQKVSILDLSYCRNISYKAIKTIGNNCKLLIKFCRNMDLSYCERRKFINDKEAEAIAATMPKLKHLEMTCNSLRTQSVIKVLLNCSHLEFLDLRGCLGIHLKNEQLKHMFPKVNVRGPLFSKAFFRGMFKT